MTATPSPRYKGLMSSYNPVAVNRAIANASRFQGKVSGREARAIHALLQGRHAGAAKGVASHHESVPAHARGSNANHMCFGRPC